MIEIRQLTREEVNRLIEEAPDHETKFIKMNNIDAFDFFSNNSILLNGLIIDGRPIYVAAVMKNKEHKYVFWTIVNSNVKDVITLSKNVRKHLNDWIKQCKVIYATMPKGNEKNQRWTEWLGFIRISEDIDTITYRLGE